MLKQVAQIVERDLFLKACYAFVYRHLSCGTLLWGSSADKCRMRLFHLQRSALRTVFGLSIMWSAVLRELELDLDSSAKDC